MSAMGELSARVSDGTLELVQAVGVPRSVSTAFCRALNEAEQPSCFVNEPFNRENDSIEQAAQFILQTVVDARQDERQVVIVKNMASYIGKTAFCQFEEISKGTIWHIRHPLVQIGSLLTRIVNDLRVHPGSDELNQSDVYPWIDAACLYLMDSPKSQNFSKTGWLSMAQHFQLARSTTYAVVEGDLFTNNPTETLSQVCCKLNIPFAGKMVNNWKKGFVNVVNHDNVEETSRSAWTSVVANSNGVVAAKREPLDVERLPEPLKRHLDETALPTYELFLDAA